MDRAVAKRYTLEQVELGLHAVARARGNTRHAGALLKQLDPPLSIPASTLKGWTTKQHVTRYEQIRIEVQSDTQSRAALEVEDALAKSLQRTKEILTRMNIAAIPEKDLPKALREVATPLGILADKSFQLRDKPLPARPPERGVDEILRSLKALNPNLVVDTAKAEELPDATVVEDQPRPADVTAMEDTTREAGV